MPACLSQFTASLGNKSRPSKTSKPETSSPTLKIPPSFGFSVYDNATFRELAGGGVTFGDKSPVARGTAERHSTCLDRSDQVVKYNWEEIRQQLDGSVEAWNPIRWSNEDDSVLLKQTNAGGRYRLVSIWKTRNSTVPGTKIAAQVAVSDWFKPEKPTPTRHNVASAIVTTTSGMAFMGLGSGPYPWADAEGGTWVSHGNLPSDTKRGETNANQWEVLEDTRSSRLTHNQNGTIARESSNQKQHNPIPRCFQTFPTSPPQGNMPDPGSEPVMGQDNQVPFPLLGLGAGMY